VKGDLEIHVGKLLLRLAGVVRKKLCVESRFRTDRQRAVYRIKDGKASSATIDRVKQAA
jgi:hypothetical protein